ncbi:MAG: APC family permease, partial [Nitrospirota bacterium]
MVILLAALYVSYRQTAAAYPDGGGAHTVAKENLGHRMAVIAGTALIIDYVLNVGVAISAGVAAVLSAIPALHPHRLGLCLVVLFTLALINLRGVKQSGVAFSLPVIVFVVCVGTALGIGIVQALLSAGHPHPLRPPPSAPKAIEAASIWLVLLSFASGCTAMTGVEAVSNAVPLFKKPQVPRAQGTLTIIVAVLGAFLLAISYLAPAYNVHAMNEGNPGISRCFRSLLAQSPGGAASITSRSPAFSSSSSFRHQTSFADFPRVCRLLAEDGFMPSFFAERGRRLVLSSGIIGLTIVSALLLIAFEGLTDRLIPLFAIGAFSAFSLSQIGMVAHWWRKRGKHARTKLALNAAGATITIIALLIIVVAKFVEGAWITVIVGPGLIWMFWRIKQHYQRVRRKVGQRVRLKTAKTRPPVVIIPVDTWNRVTERAVRFGMEMSDEITAVHVSTEHEDTKRLREAWIE